MKKFMALIVSLLLLTGCATQSATVSVSTPTPVLTPVITPTLTPMPTHTPTPTVVPIPSPTITPAETKSGLTENEEMSKAVTKFMFESFGGSGDKQYATSWYDEIIEIKIFNTDADSGAFCRVFVKPDCLNAKTIGMCIMTNFKDVNIGYIMVSDENMNVLFDHVR